LVYWDVASPTSIDRQPERFDAVLDQACMDRQREDEGACADVDPHFRVVGGEGAFLEALRQFVANVGQVE